MTTFTYTLRPRSHGYDFIAGVLCLDFANTVDNRKGLEIKDNLPSYRALIRFSQQAGALPDPLADQLLQAATEHPKQAEAVHARAVALREAIFRVFSQPKQDDAPAQADIDLLNQELGKALGHMRLAATPNGFEWQWDEVPDLEWPLWPIAQSAGELLSTSRRQQVRECAADDCGWLFLDTTKNHSRRWCDMKGCGNRAKVQRFRQKEA